MIVPPVRVFYMSVIYLARKFFLVERLILTLSIRAKSRNGASGTSDMDGNAARVAARESGDEQVQALTASEISRDVSASVDMTTDYLHH